MSTTITTDHPGWTTGPNDEPVRLVEHQGAPWFVNWRGAGLTLRPLGSDDAEAPPVDYASPINLPRLDAAAPLVKKLATLGTVARLRNPSLWDAITTAILRQVVRAPQARAVYRRWCQIHGRTLDTPAGALFLVPEPETVLSLPDDAFASTGTKFHRTALQAAAASYLTHHDTWLALTPDELVKALDDVPRIGPWTASAAAADYTGDFSVYPHGDLAVRTWARRAAPDLSLPDTDRPFADQWRRWASHDAKQLHTLTLFTLTWGSHARTDQHGDTEHNEPDRRRR